MILYIAGVVIAGLIIGILSSQYAGYVLHKEQGFDKPKFFSKREIIVGVLSAMIWLLLFVRLGFNWVTILYALSTFALIGLSIVDWCSYEIPIQYNYYIFVIGVVRLALDYKHWPTYVIGMLLVSGIFYIILLATKGRGMGGGDVKLMFTVGLLLGWKLILVTMIIGCVLGSVIHTVIAKIKKGDHMLAFGPYLSVASIIAMVVGNPIVSWYAGYITGSMNR